SEQVKQLLELMKSHNISVGLHLEFSDSNFKSEIEKQYGRFFSIFKTNPSHIDLHKSTYLKESYPVIMKFCKEKNLPCRNHKIDSVDVIKTQNEVLNGTGMSLDELKNTVSNFKDGESYEILFHPGVYDSDCKSSLNKIREDDIKKIEEINPFLKENNIKLISYVDLVSV
ncbi:MAG TPA: ChbG/HpnK family deacetylase, partial [Candidatus Kaiserbacteria bacterium]|nr:ChbG/HpnK family deacetylase [Candidatus Kaiserbacteria bacterium]